MFHMLFCFDLKPGEEIGAFKAALAELTAHLRQRDLVEGTGPIAARRSDTILDTDVAHPHRYLARMTFRDRAQADAAVAYIQAQTEPGQTLHKTAFAKVQDPVFTCWEDME